ncbi:uncharacterized protein M421DRAFT_159368 [Didymella exigua CBS 183.55]|uniref:Uncharacterized protein n=1 Tax=Didymella exigua CBS 183.55 TaxID=1150837 RepID=A0A6A5RJ10_9PLEO|nr:uncharacterized protein M421DRAFT_159368 [Didymella exigua CBS 183.55]KAF1928365.1 hypothetical protein M421DRAFT_159368 [Didymella exigua CBS 183.55]
MPGGFLCPCLLSEALWCCLCVSRGCYVHCPFLDGFFFSILLFSCGLEFGEGCEKRSSLFVQYTIPIVLLTHLLCRWMVQLCHRHSCVWGSRVMRMFFCCCVHALCCVHTLCSVHTPCRVHTLCSVHALCSVHTLCRVHTPCCVHALCSVHTL